MSNKYCKVCKAVVHVDDETQKEFLNGAPHKSHGAQSFCVACMRHFPNVEFGFRHMLMNFNHRVHFWDEPHKEGAFVMGVPKSLL